jgi:hypothetical protein
MLINSDSISISGTHLQGEIRVSFDKLQSVFGNPILNEPGDKVQAEWMILFDNGVVATIYDWKEYGTPYEKVSVWHVGGFSKSALYKVRETLSI